MPERLHALAELLMPEAILLDANVHSKQEVFAAVGLAMQGRHGLTQQRVIDSLNARELLGSTALGDGVAVPHARVSGLDQAVAVYIRPRPPIDFDAPDGKAVTDIVAILVPERASAQHLRLLAAVADLFQDDEFSSRIHRCTDADAVSQLFAEWAQRHSA